MSNEREYQNWIHEQLEPEWNSGPSGSRYKRESPYMQDIKRKDMIKHIGEIEWNQKTKEEQDRCWHIWDSTHK